MAITVAVTGGIGAGKSTVSGLLAARGAILVDSDQLAREVVGPGTAGLDAVVAAFGPGVRGSDGTLDRTALAAIVFADTTARRRLEAITHPIIRARFGELTAAAPRGSVVVNDIPLLTSLDAAAAFHLAVGVGAPEAVRIDRLIQRGMSERDARARIAAQLRDDERRPLCEVWVDNGGAPAQARKQADLLWSRLTRYAANVEAGRRAARGGPVLVPYNPTWPQQAERLAARLHHLVGPEHRVDHIGSTAVPGLAAKPVIDLQLSVDDLPQADALVEVLAYGGFPRLPEITWDTVHAGADGGSDRGQWEKRLHVNADPGLGVNLHLRVRYAANWLFALRFRDWLRADPAAVAAYEKVKRRLAVGHAGDATVAGYTEGKEAFLERAGRDSAAWADAVGWEPT